MRFLVLGGTFFLGRHLVDAALARGHRVTLFNRGRRAVPWPDVESLRGDRDGGLDALDGRRWDAAVDTSGYVPRIVRASARKLAAAVAHYTFVSSASVYVDSDTEGRDESAPVRVLDDPATEDIPGNYGALKVACEREVEDAMPGRALHVRAGLIVGPHDATGRFDYWVARMARDGEVLAPGDPRRAVQLVDARDLADWIVAMAERGTAGVFNATGPATRLSMRAMLDACRTTAVAPCTWVDERWLLAHEVAPFADLPFWLPRAEQGLLALDVGKAVASGLRFRPLADTVRACRDAGGAADPRSVAPLASGVASRAGLDEDRERRLLAAWHGATRRDEATRVA